MGVVSKQGVKFTIILYVGIILGYVNTILVFPHILSEEEFGLTRMLAAASAIVTQFTILGADNIIIRFSPFFKDEKRQNTILSIGIVIAFIGFILIGTPFFIFKDFFIQLFKEKSQLFVDYSYLVIPLAISLLFYNLFDAYLRVIFKNVFAVFLNFIFLRVAWLLSVIVYYFEWVSFPTFLWIYVACQSLVTLIVTLYLIYLGHFKLSFKFNNDVILKLKNISWFGIFTILSGISTFMINRLDTVMIGEYIGLDAVAIYAIAFNMSSVILVPSQALSRTVTVLISNAAKNNDFENLNNLYKKTAVNQLLFGAIVFALIAVNYTLLMQFLPPFYKDSIYIFLFLGGAKVIDSAFGANAAIILNSKYYKIDSILSIFLLIITFGSNIYFIPRYGVTGASFATALSITIYNVMRFLFLKFKMNLSPFDIKYVIGLGICIITAVVPYLVPSFKSIWVDSILRSILMLGLFSFLTYFSRISPELNGLLTSTFQKFGIKV